MAAIRATAPVFRPAFADHACLISQADLARSSSRQDEMRKVVAPAPLCRWHRDPDSGKLLSAWTADPEGPQRGQSPSRARFHLRLVSSP